MNTSPTSSQAYQADIAIAGGGLSGGLLAYRLATTRPELNILLIDGAASLGGNHTWSFHDSDLSPLARDWIKPFVTYRWEGQSVRFPQYSRDLETPYQSVASTTFEHVLRETLGENILNGTKAAALGEDHIILEDQRVIKADAVIDARGQRGFDHLALGFQKFVGLELEFEKPHGLKTPIIMDATVPQLDGYRFVYVLPFTETNALVEDTYYADGAQLETDAIESRIHAYCGQRGWDIAKVIRREAGILPIALGGDIKAHLDHGPSGVGTIGLAAGLFHPLTGYSLPDAAAMVDRIAASPDLSGPTLARLTREHATETWERRSFYRFLSRMLFDAAKPEKRYEVMQRFYKFHRPLIERFYAGQSNTADKMRVLAGKPPVPVGAAMKCVSERGWMKRRAS